MASQTAEIDPQRLAALQAKFQQYNFLQEREFYEGSLTEFVKGAWSSIDSSEYQPSWAGDAICDHLEAVTLGHIPRLLINVPPRCSKTTIASICWPAWTWAQPEAMHSFWAGPHVKFLCGSYGNSLALLSSNTMRRLIMSPWYQRYWANRYGLTEDQNTKNRYDTTAGGTRQATSVGSSLLGLGGDIIICLPYDERVLTDNGWIAIGDIVEKRLQVRVGGWDHSRSCFVWQEIEKYEKNPSSDIIEIQWDSGSIRCTPDHPIWIEGRGYIAAKDVQKKETLWAYNSELSELREDISETFCEEEKILQSEVWVRPPKTTYSGRRVGAALRYVWKTYFSNCSPVAEFRFLPRAGAFLREVLFWCCGNFRWEPSLARGKRNGTVRSLQKSFRERPHQPCASLFQILCRSFKLAQTGSCGCCSGVSGLREFFRSPFLPGEKILFSQVQGSCSFKAHVGPESSKLYRWTISSSLSKGLEQSIARNNSRERRSFLSDLWQDLANRYKYVSSSPHRLCASKSKSDEFDYAMSKLPRQNASKKEAVVLDRKVITSIKRAGGAASTYNLRVAPTHNYFAEGVLVHNCDDPHNTETEKVVETDADRIKVASWWRELSSTRLNSPKLSAIVVVMQRLHEGDLSGIILDSTDEDWVHLMIPMRHDPQRHCVTVKLPQYDVEEPWEDPRVEEDELMWPERFGEAEVRRLESRLGPYMASGRLQQSPSPKGGGIIKREWWQPWDAEEAQRYGLSWGAELKEFPHFELVVGSLDTSYGEKQENDFNALTIWGIWIDKNKNRRAMLMFGWAKRLPLHGTTPPLLLQFPGEATVNYEHRLRKNNESHWGLIEWIADTCKRYKVRRLLIENKTRGRDVANEIKRLYEREPWAPQLLDPVGDKVSRTHSVVSIFTDNAVWAPDTRWAEQIIDQCQKFPKTDHDDLHDTVTQVLHWFRENGILIRADEASAALEDESAYRQPVRSIASHYGI